MRHIRHYIHDEFMINSINNLNTNSNYSLKRMREILKSIGRAEEKFSRFNFT